MELIDRVAFMKDLAKRTEANKDLCRDDAQYLRVVTVMNGFFRDLKEFPTVEVESRPEGEWTEEYNAETGVTGGICSNCGKWVFCGVSYDLWGNKHTDNYCKYCGADMRGEQHE